MFSVLWWVWWVGVDDIVDVFKQNTVANIKIPIIRKNIEKFSMQITPGGHFFINISTY
jgi:hypothetical protein